VSDHCGVDQRSGTLGDVVGFTDQAEESRPRVIAGLVLTHATDQHPWFDRGTAAGAASRTR
jgi:glycosidase